MLLKFLGKFYSAAESTVIFDTDECQEFTHPGKLQGWSGLIVLIMFVILGLSMPSKGMPGIFIQTSIVYFSFLMGLFLVCLIPSIKQRSPLELSRWIYRHIFWYVLLITISIITIGS